MDDCITIWRKYIRLMREARYCRKTDTRRELVRNAYEWLEVYFDAVERELARKTQIYGR
jgi:hypothetical protein